MHLSLPITVDKFIVQRDTAQKEKPRRREEENSRHGVPNRSLWSYILEQGSERTSISSKAIYIWIYFSGENYFRGWLGNRCRRGTG